MSNYVKLFGSILDSTVWKLPPAIKVVWVTMMAMADRDGVVEASLPGLAHRAQVPLPTAEKAIGIFLAPDPHSKTPSNEGRRIEVVTGGWRLLNFEAYREKQSLDDRKTKNAARQQRFRDRQAQRDAAVGAGVTPPVTLSNAPLRSVTPRDASCSDLLSSSGSGPPPKPPDQTRPPARSNWGAISAGGLAPPRAPYRPIPVGVVTPQFIEVYEAYPRKDARLKAAVVFDELAAEYPGGGEQLAGEILAAFRAGMLKRHPYAGANNFRPTLETVLVERRWLDAPPAPDNEQRPSTSAYRKL